MFKNRRAILAILTMLVLVIPLTACGKSSDGVIAKVNGEDIKLDDFNKEFEVVKSIRQKQNGEDVLEKEIDGKPYKEILKEEIFNMYVDEAIISQDLEKLEIGVTDKEVEEQTNLIKETYMEELGGEEEYKSFLEENGLTEEYLERTVKREIMVQKHREDFLNKIHLKDEDIEKYYEENKDGLLKVSLNHILVEDEAQGKKILEELAKEGSDFHALAAKESIDSQTAEKGGELGFVRKGDLEKMGLGELEESVFELKEGEHSDLVESGLGLHILYVDERLESLEDLKDDVIESLKYEKYIEKVQELKEAADIKIIDKDFKF